jgi:signal-transduction protein with cAMP-binding, CBS, and nucleotidyltransferase domain
VFIRKILVSMHCAIFLPSASIIEKGQDVYNLFFVYKGTITVNDKNKEELSLLPSGSFFGDY